ncbi:MauE/DoxX family redox-associated membrane protein [Streptomyces sp. NPDC021096]|uniref:MauE/DoxX family redox-associated membrane protein n=1 Tax=Streptomyces sp. NPDC021096 TaxID=3154792 RepID=UPI0033C24CD8
MLYVRTGLCGVLVVVFLAAAVSKCRSRSAFAGFRAAVAALMPAAAHVGPAIAVGVIAAEWSVAVLLAVPSTVTVGFALAAAVLGAFTAVTVTAVRRRSGVGCRCFGARSRPVGAVHVVRNVLLLAAAVAGLVTGLLPAGGPGAPAGVAVAAGVGGGAGFLLTVLDELVDVFTSPDPLL